MTLRHAGFFLDFRTASSGGLERPSVAVSCGTALTKGALQAKRLQNGGPSPALERVGSGRAIDQWGNSENVASERKQSWREVKNRTTELPNHRTAEQLFVVGPPGFEPGTVRL